MLMCPLENKAPDTNRPHHWAGIKAWLVTACSRDPGLGPGRVEELTSLLDSMCRAEGS